MWVLSCCGRVILYCSFWWSLCWPSPERPLRVPSRNCCWRFGPYWRPALSVPVQSQRLLSRLPNRHCLFFFLSFVFLSFCLFVFFPFWQNLVTSAHIRLGGLGKRGERGFQVEFRSKIFSQNPSFLKYKPCDNNMANEFEQKWSKIKWQNFHKKTISWHLVDSFFELWREPIDLDSNLSSTTCAQTSVLPSLASN